MIKKIYYCRGKKSYYLIRINLYLFNLYLCGRFFYI